MVMIALLAYMLTFVALVVLLLRDRAVLVSQLNEALRQLAALRMVLGSGDATDRRLAVRELLRHGDLTGTMVTTPESEPKKDDPANPETLARLE